MYPNRDINGGSVGTGGGGVDPDVITGIDLQLAALEVKTSNQASAGQSTNFTGNIHADTMTTSNTVFDDDQDVVNKKHFDSRTANQTVVGQTTEFVGDVVRSSSGGTGTLKFQSVVFKGDDPLSTGRRLYLKATGKSFTRTGRHIKSWACRLTKVITQRHRSYA